MKKYETLEQRVRRHVSRAVRMPNGCLEIENMKSHYFNFGFKGQTYILGREILRLKYGSIPEGKFMRHLCGNKKCIDENHMVLGTHQENMIDNAYVGKCGGQKLNAKQVRDIRYLFLQGKTKKDLSELYPVSEMMIYLIVSGRKWKHLQTDNLPLDLRPLAPPKKDRKFKLTSKQVSEIRSMYMNEEPIEDIARSYGVSASHVRNIISGKIWKHLNTGNLPLDLRPLVHPVRKFNSIEDKVKWFLEHKTIQDGDCILLNTKTETRLKWEGKYFRLKNLILNGSEYNKGDIIKTSCGKKNCIKKDHLFKVDHSYFNIQRAKDGKAPNQILTEDIVHQISPFHTKSSTK